MQYEGSGAGWADLEVRTILADRKRAVTLAVREKENFFVPEKRFLDFPSELFRYPMEAVFIFNQRNYFCFDLRLDPSGQGIFWFDLAVLRFVNRLNA